MAKQTKIAAQVETNDAAQIETVAQVAAMPQGEVADAAQPAQVETPAEPAAQPRTKIGAQMLAQAAALAAKQGDAPAAPLLAYADASGLRVAESVPAKVRKGDALPQAGAWFVGLGNKPAPSRTDGQGGIALALGRLQARAGYGAAGVVDLRALLVECFAAGVDATCLGGSTRALTNSDKGKRGPNGATLAPFTLYVAPAPQS